MSSTLRDNSDCKSEEPRIAADFEEGPHDLVFAAQKRARSNSIEPYPPPRDDDVVKWFAILDRFGTKALLPSLRACMTSLRALCADMRQNPTDVAKALQECAREVMPHPNYEAYAIMQLITQRATVHYQLAAINPQPRLLVVTRPVFGAYVRVNIALRLLGGEPHNNMVTICTRDIGKDHVECTYAAQCEWRGGECSVVMDAHITQKYLSVHVHAWADGRVYDASTPWFGPFTITASSDMARQAVVVWGDLFARAADNTYTLRMNIVLRHYMLTYTQHTQRDCRRIWPSPNVPITLTRVLARCDADAIVRTANTLGPRDAWAQYCAVLTTIMENMLAWKLGYILGWADRARAEQLLRAAGCGACLLRVGSIGAVVASYFTGNGFGHVRFVLDSAHRTTIMASVRKYMCGRCTRIAQLDRAERGSFEVDYTSTTVKFVALTEALAACHVAATTPYEVCVA